MSKSTRQCRMCRKVFTPRRSIDFHCGPLCSKRAEVLEMRRARVVYRALYWWRFDRKNSMDALRFICREIADWIAEDRMSQRLPPPRYDPGQSRGHERKPARRAIPPAETTNHRRVA